MTFDNGPRILVDLASSRTPWGPDRLHFRTDNGLEIECPNVPGARVPVYEVFAEDAYRLEELVQPLGPSLVALDVGSQVGCFALALARLVPGAIVHAYEASPTTANWTRENVTRNALEDRITVHAVAVGAEGGTLTMPDNGQASGLNGLTSSDARMVTVPAVSFDAAVAEAGGQVDLVKIDTEGAEYDIVLASSPQAWDTVRAVVLEYHPVPGRSWAQLKDYFAAVGLNEWRHEPAWEGQGTAWLRRS